MWTDTPTVHLLPQKWNFKAGQKVPVYIYTNAKSVELFLNGKSLGIKNYDKQTASRYISTGQKEPADWITKQANSKQSAMTSRTEKET